MSELPRHRGRRLAAFAVAFLLPARRDLPSVFHPADRTPQTCATAHQRRCVSWISDDQIAAWPQTIGRENARIFHDYAGVGGGTLFASAARTDEDAEPRSRPVSAHRQIDHDAEEADLTDDDTGVSVRIPESGTERWRRLRSTAVARTLGRVFRGRPGLVEEHGTFNSVVSRQRLPVGRRAGGLLSPFRDRRRRRRRQVQTGPDPADGRLAEAVGREGGGVCVREGEQEKPRASRKVNVAAAGSDGGGVASGSAVGGRRTVAPAKHDGEDVLPEIWAKVDVLRTRAESSDPNAGQEERGLHAWLATGEEGGYERKGLTDTDLLRFVLFRHGDVDAAWSQLKQAAAWRQERRVEAVLSEDQWSRHRELQAEMFWLGRDVQGRPTMVLRSIAHHPGVIDPEDFERYFLYLLEQGRQLWGLGSEQQLNIVVDRIGAGIKNQDPRLLRSMLPVFRDAYPDIVYRQSRLLEDFDPSVLPPHLGGTMPDYPPKQPPDIE